MGVCYQKTYFDQSGNRNPLGIEALQRADLGVSRCVCCDQPFKLAVASPAGPFLKCKALRFELRQFGFDLFQVLPAEEAAAVAVAEPRTEGVVALKVPTFDGDAGEFLRAIAAVLIAKDILFADVLRAGGVLAEEF